MFGIHVILVGYEVAEFSELSLNNPTLNPFRCVQTGANPGMPTGFKVRQAAEESRDNAV